MCLAGPFGHEGAGVCQKGGETSTVIKAHGMMVERGRDEEIGEQE
jgi:hypothetical protein